MGFKEGYFDGLRDGRQGMFRIRVSMISTLKAYCSGYMVGYAKATGEK